VINKLNLATNPFRNRTTPYLTAFALLIVGFAGIVLGAAQWRQAAKDNEITARQITEMEAELQRLKAEGEKVRQQLTPEQRELLFAAHKLVANKTFGWSRLFADLESVMPGGVSANRIVVQNVFRDADKVAAEIEFGVISRDFQAVMSMIQAMNNSGVFRAELRGQDLQKTDTSTYTEYRLRLIYTPSYTYAVNSATDGHDGGTKQ
jgi:Tfp pilus assembly protein PilN